MNVFLTVCLSYGGLRANALTGQSINSVIDFVRKDLTALKLDQPPSENIKVAGPGRVEFSWHVKKDGSLHQSLEMKINPDSPSCILKTDPERLCALSIIGVEYHTKVTTHPLSSKHQAREKEGAHSVPRSTNKTCARDSNQNQDASTTRTCHSQTPHGPLDRAHALSHLLFGGSVEKTASSTGGPTQADATSDKIEPEASFRRGGALSDLMQYSDGASSDVDHESSSVLNMPERTRAESPNSIASSSGRKRSTPAPLPSTSNAVEDMAHSDSLAYPEPSSVSQTQSNISRETDLGMERNRGRKRSRSLSPESECSRSSSGVPPFRPSSRSIRQFQPGRNIFGNEDVTDFASNAARSRSPKARTRYSASSSQPLSNPASRSSSQSRLQSPVKPSSLPASRTNSQPQSIPTGPRLQFAPRTLSKRKPPTQPRALARLDDDRMQSSSRSTSKDQDASSGKHVKLISELDRLKDDLRTGAERQRAILKELRNLGADEGTLKDMELVVKSANKSNPDAMNSTTEVNARLQAVRKEIELERRKSRAALAELDTIKRECREPFVVPALLEAFISISELTTKGMEMNRK